MHRFIINIIIIILSIHFLQLFFFFNLFILLSSSLLILLSSISFSLVCLSCLVFDMYPPAATSFINLAFYIFL